jgi:hypothetical protein
MASLLRFLIFSLSLPPSMRASAMVTEPVSFYRQAGENVDKSAE